MNAPKLPRRRLRSCAIALGGLWLALAGFRAHEPKGPIVIYLIDTLRADRVSVYGSPRSTTPSAVQLAREGLVFQNAYALSSWTRPSVATLLTSLLPSAAGAIDQFGTLSEHVPYLPALLHERGWKTAAFVSNINIYEPRTGFRRGFDEFYGFPGVHRDGHPIADEVVTPVLRFLAEQRSPRFFLYVHVQDPHWPDRVVPPYATLFGGDQEASSSEGERERLLLKYDRTIVQSDDQFGRILDALRERDWFRSATILYTSDHGEEFYDHGGLSHGQTIYEEQLRVPMILKYPDELHAGQRRDDPVTLADVVPTIAQLTGARESKSWIGRSLLGAPFPANREIYVTEDQLHARFYGLKRGAQKLIVQLYPKFQRMLFDLGRDPQERSGEALPCDAALGSRSRELLRSAAHWRAADSAAFPAVRFEKQGRVPVEFTLLADLPKDEDPFLTDDEYCRFASRIEGHALRVREQIGRNEPFTLSLSAMDNGTLPPFRASAIRTDDGRTLELESERSDFRVVHVTAPLLSEFPFEMKRVLRSLGYLE